MITTIVNHPTSGNEMVGFDWTMTFDTDTKTSEQNYIEVSQLSGLYSVILDNRRRLQFRLFTLNAITSSKIALLKKQIRQLIDIKKALKMKIQ